MWRIKNRPSSHDVSCSDDNALRLLVLVTGMLYRRLQVTSFFSIWGCVLKGYITLFSVISMLCRTDNIMRNIPHTQSKCKEYSTGLILFYGIFSVFGMYMGNIL